MPCCVVACLACLCSRGPRFAGWIGPRGMSSLGRCGGGGLGEPVPTQSFGRARLAEATHLKKRAKAGLHTKRLVSFIAGLRRLSPGQSMPPGVLINGFSNLFRSGVGCESTRKVGRQTSRKCAVGRDIVEMHCGDMAIQISGRDIISQGPERQTVVCARR